MRRFATNIVLIAVSVLLMYGILEIAYRIVLYQQRVNGYEAFPFWWTDQPFHIFDAQTGYTYPPNKTIRHTLTTVENTSVIGHHVAVNHVGALSPDDVPAQKPADEYWIALIGDSFTASIFNETPWAIVLENLLNADIGLKNHLNIQAFRVLNFGLEAIGMEQFDDVFQNRAAPLKPDWVIVSFISDDIRRRFLWRDTVTISANDNEWTLSLTCYSLPITIKNPDCFYTTLVLPQDFVVARTGLDAMRRDIYESNLARLPWTAFYPELFAALVGYRWEIAPRLRPGLPEQRIYHDDSVALERSQQALEAIFAAQDNTLVFHIPTHVELLNARQIEPLAQQFIAANPDFGIIETWEHWQAEDDQIRAWYSNDNHFGDAAAAHYAEIVYQVLAQSLLP